MVYGIDIRNKVLKKIKHEDSSILNDENLEKLLTNSDIHGEEFLKFFLYEKYKDKKNLSYENTDPDIFNEINNAYSWLDQYEANGTSNFNICNTLWTMKYYLIWDNENLYENDELIYNPKLNILDYISDNLNDVYEIYISGRNTWDGIWDNFLDASYQIGSFIPFPKGLVFGEPILFDRILNCIYKWYAANENKEINANNELSTLFDNNQLKEDMIVKLSKWLTTFKSWKGFIHANYLEPFIDKKNMPLELMSQDTEFLYYTRLRWYVEKIYNCIRKRTYLISKSLKIDIPQKIKIEYSGLHTQLLKLSSINTDNEIITSAMRILQYILYRIIGKREYIYPWDISNLAIFTMLCYGIFLMLIFFIGKIFGLNIFVYKKPANYFLNKYFFLIICLILSTAIAYGNREFLDDHFENHNKLKKVITYAGDLGTVGLCIIELLKILIKNPNWIINICQNIAILCLIITLVNLMLHDTGTYKNGYGTKPIRDFVKCIFIYFCIYLLLIILVFAIEHFYEFLTIIIIVMFSAILLKFMKFEDK